MSECESIVWRGIKYRRYPNSKSPSDSRYFRSGGGTGYLHRHVWEEVNGPIPDEHHIHHIDGDAANNNIDNLELMSAKDHIKHHAESWSDERRQKNLELVEKIRPLTKEWHASEEGRIWHSNHGKKLYAKRENKTKVCEKCSAEYSTKHRGNAKFCSNACKSSWRRSSGLDNESRTCKGCGEKFQVNKYKKVQCCSKECGGIMRRAASMKERIRICAFCEKTFEAQKHLKKKCCSNSCAQKRRQKQARIG